MFLLFLILRVLLLRYAYEGRIWCLLMVWVMEIGDSTIENWGFALTDPLSISDTYTIR